MLHKSYGVGFLKTHTRYSVCVSGSLNVRCLLNNYLITALLAGGVAAEESMPAGGVGAPSWATCGPVRGAARVALRDLPPALVSSGGSGVS